MWPGLEKGDEGHLIRGRIGDVLGTVTLENLNIENNGDDDNQNYDNDGRNFPKDDDDDEDEGK